MEWYIAKRILHNAKRMKRLCNSGRHMREQARRYVVAECAAQKVRLTEEQIRRAAVIVVERSCVPDEA